VAWYFRRRPGRKIRIRSAWGTPEFDAAYEAALTGAKPAPRAGPSGGTLAWLFDRYREVSAWTELAASTKYKRERIMVKMLEASGTKRLATITKATIEAGVERRKGAPSSAQAFVDTLHGVFKWAHKAGHVTSDPTTGVEVKLKPKRKGGYPPWTDDDMAAYEAFWPIGTRERLLFDLLCFTGLRIGDIARLGRQHVSKGRIRIDTEKSQGTMRVDIPMLSALKATIDASPMTGDLAFLVTRRGKPWNKGALGTYFSDSARAAGIHGKSAHGMRKAAAIRSAIGGASEREMEAIFGWKGGRMARLYAELASRIRLAGNAIHTLDRPQAEEPETGTSMDPPDEKVGPKTGIGE
jgi:integrase